MPGDLMYPVKHGEKVFNRLFDPADTTGLDVLVVGGGDSAIETAIAVSEFAESVTISYRKKSFSRPKDANLQKIKDLESSGKVKVLFESSIKEIQNDKVLILQAGGSELELKNDMVFSLIGKELPLDFFKRSGIRMEGELTKTSKLQFLLLILISGVIYFGKNSVEFIEQVSGGSVLSYGEIFNNILTPGFWLKFFLLPVSLVEKLFSSDVQVWNANKYISSILAYFCFISAVVLGLYLLVKFVKAKYDSFSFDWPTFKYLYFIGVGLFFLAVFFGEKYFGVTFLDKSQGFWYTGFYSLTILIFGLRRIHLKPTGYIKRQTWTLILIQALPLFIFPELIFPMLGGAGLMGNPEGFIMTQIFPTANWAGAQPSYWRSYGFILAWPLNFGNLYDGQITNFWLIFSLVQTFLFIPFIVYKWGKGAYCGWICSCGALAETLGDEYRTLAPHGPTAKKWENIGQWILLAAFIITGLKLIGILFRIEIPVINESFSYTADFLKNFYYIGIDIIFAGVLGVGVYFFLSGRVWCRFGCPLAALMHIYTRFSRYRIFAEKKKCISCNICTKVCHMGIDVMNYANKGIPMNDVECVRCSACIINCPTEVLSFGSLPSHDTNNTSYKVLDSLRPDKNHWTSGL